MSVYNDIIAGLNEAIDYNEGKIKAKRVKLSVEPPPSFEAADVKRVRLNLGMTQILFAALMGVSQKTVEAWECGRNSPDGAARRILGMFEKDPELPHKCGILVTNE